MNPMTSASQSHKQQPGLGEPPALPSNAFVAQQSYARPNLITPTTQVPNQRQPPPRNAHFIPQKPTLANRPYEGYQNRPLPAFQTPANRPHRGNQNWPLPTSQAQNQRPQAYLQRTQGQQVQHLPDSRWRPGPRLPSWGFGQDGPPPLPMSGGTRSTEQIERQKIMGQRWIKTEPYWKHRLGDNWVAKKVLGQGAMGIVGWWQYQGSDANQRTVTNVAVKQARYSYGARRGHKKEGLGYEAEIYKILGRAKSHHIPRMYGHVYTDEGRSSNHDSDVDAFTVHRMFMEYCPGGDLWGFMEAKRKKLWEDSQPKPLTIRWEDLTYWPVTCDWDEIEIWEVFHCFARAAHVMAYQSELKLQAGQPHVEIFHSDIKPGNILLGGVTTDAEHLNAPVFKVADFGFSTKVPVPITPQYILERQAGTPDYFLPEQVQHTNFYFGRTRLSERPWLPRDASGPTLSFLERKFGSPSNVWQLGLIMWCMAHGVEDPDWRALKLIRSNRTQRLMYGGATLGDEFDECEARGELNMKYSRNLYDTIRECLLIIPDLRIPVGELVEVTGNALHQARRLHRLVGRPGVGHAPYREPRLSDRWYSGQTLPPTQDELNATLADALVKAQEIKEEKERQIREDIAKQQLVIAQLKAERDRIQPEEAEKAKLEAEKLRLEEINRLKEQAKRRRKDQDEENTRLENERVVPEMKKATDKERLQELVPTESLNKRSESGKENIIDFNSRQNLGKGTARIASNERDDKRRVQRAEQIMRDEQSRDQNRRRKSTTRIIGQYLAELDIVDAGERSNHQTGAQRIVPEQKKVQASVPVPPRHNPSSMWISSSAQAIRSLTIVIPERKFFQTTESRIVVHNLHTHMTILQLKMRICEQRPHTILKKMDITQGDRILSPHWILGDILNRGNVLHARLR